ncbi:phthiocerol/phenolphthiocerol synthesis type-I polyketide synthase E [Streptomyces sp. LBL]|uniref:type I polyketide synthase n=1 Tax=Streptomyces sp. LBL TaxID=2940562 RepID=UPI00247363FA|nr:beta-ketoacyl synthase N-terminal-like domain-containing protein [Streptomyces sp. LBL]MDH6624462.1 phthiocerol/phenolphthiocerol synthesis type-I polyketide synthase E [Streptomyces sp. LBL]
MSDSHNHPMADDVAAPEAFDIAVVGLAGRFPGAATADEFWQLLAEGREAVRDVTDEEFLAAGGDPADLDDPSLVRKVSAPDGIDLFDAAFFGFSPADAELLDPQQRLILECGYHTLEDAGYVVRPEETVVGVYAGADDSTYYPAHVYPRFAGSPSSVAQTHASISSSMGAVATRISYELGLTGPSLTVQTTCSTGLVTVHTACQDLLGFKCDLALAAAVSINPSGPLGYRHVPDGPFSPDGRCRAFDADAEGTVSGSGAGAVVLKRLEDALADGDRIRAVIKGTAVNNDGRRKVGFTAPSVEGQTEVILEAQAVAGVDADSVTYVEAHGTGTRIGDPIEVTALTRAFRESTDRRQYCALGSAKTNIGHLGAAAGIVGLIKTVLALEHRAIPPSLHFDTPNPLIDFASSPFRVPTRLEPWESPDGPRRAAVSAFGVGGTNAHVVVEEAPATVTKTNATDAKANWQVLPLSARTPAAITSMGADLAAHLDDHPAVTLGDIAHSLWTGRPEMGYRRAVVATDAADAVRALSGALPAADHVGSGRVPAVAFLLPGGGTQYVGMGAGLYRELPVYRDAIDTCARILRPHIGHDLRTDLYENTEPGSPEAFLSLVATQYALASTLLEHGVCPDALIGHSLGEYTAACLAGTLSLEQMLPLVATRLRLIVAAGGATTSVALGDYELHAYLADGPGGVSLAAVNGPCACTVAGREDAVAALEARLAADGVTFRRLRMPAAAHSMMLDPVLDTFATALRGVTFRPPRIRYVTNVTGTWITDERATDIGHWLAHTRETVRYADGIATLFNRDTPLLLEVGPGEVLTTLARTALPDAAPRTLPTLRHAKAERPDLQVFAETLGRLWSAGVPVDLARWNGTSGTRRRVPLPPYPFDRRSHWIPAPGASSRPTDLPEREVEEASRAPRPHLAVPFTAPRTAAERAVAAHWEDVLGITGIGVEDNFFDLGGDSMRAVLLTNRLRTAGVLDVPVKRLLAAPTIAALVSDAAEDAFAPVLALRSGGTRRPLFCVHPSIGTAWCYTALLPRLGPDQPVYGLQAYGLDGRHPVAEDARRMVADYLGQVRALQPHGPYRLLGGSYGGVVVHAMATELRRQGEEVELLAMMDSPLPEFLASVPVPGQEDAERQIAAILQGDGSEMPVGADDVRAMARVFANNLRISPGFELGRFDGELLFFTADDHGSVPEGLPAPVAAEPLAVQWQRHLDGAVHDHQLHCGHYEMTRPEHIARVGDVLAAALHALDHRVPALAGKD